MDERVVLVIPPNPRFVRTVRLAMSGLASVVGFDIEAIEDLRIAIDELCSALIELGTGDLTIHADVGPGHLSVVGEAAAGPNPDERDRLEFSRALLSVVADRYDLRTADGRVTCSFERSKHSSGMHHARSELDS